MVWDIPRDERPNHVCNPWVWIPDAPVRDVAIQIQTVDELMDHLRTIPRQGPTPCAACGDVSASKRHRWRNAQPARRTPRFGESQNPGCLEELARSYPEVSQ